MSFSAEQRATPGGRDPALKPYRPVRISAGWVVMVLLLAFVVGDLLWRVLRFGGLVLPYGLTDAVILAGALASRVTTAVHGPPVPWPAAGTTPTVEFTDRPFADARRWEDRLAWTHDDAVSFNRTVRTRLVGMVDERLRYVHGTDLAGTGPGGPDRVRTLLGDPLWTIVTRPVDRPPGPGEMAAVVDGIERLFAQQGFSANREA